MAEDVLKNLSDRLTNTIRETNEFFNTLRVKDVVKPAYNPDNTTNGARLRSIESVTFPDKKWVLPYTLPVKATDDRTHREAYEPVVLPAPVISGRHGQLSVRVKKEAEEVKHEEGKLDPNFEGWSERQKKVFLKFAADAENKMRLESLRLQDEYNKQLASKLAMVKNELYETNRKNLIEMEGMRMERERWLLEKSEVRATLEGVSSSLDSLQKAYDNLNNELEGKDFHINNLNEELGKSEEVVKILRHDVEVLQNELHEKSKEVSRLQNDVSDAYLRLELESTKFNNADKDLISVNLLRKELSEQNKELKVQLDALKLANKFTQSEKSELANRNLALEEEVADLKKDALTLKTMVRNFELSESARVAALQEKVEILNVQLKSAQIDLIAADKRLEVESLNKEVQELKNSLKRMDTENETLYKENAVLQSKLDQEKALVKEHLNDLFAAKCKTHTLKAEVRNLKENLKLAAKQIEFETKKPKDSSPKPHSLNPKDLSFKDFNADLYKIDLNQEKPKRRDLFAPTMFDGPDEATQAKIDELENQLTGLYLERDRLESEMTRCKLGPGSPTMQRRQHFVLEGKLEETKKKINEVSAEIKKLNKSNVD